MLSSHELAYLIGVDPKWVHNAALRLKRPIRHSVKEAIRLALAQRVHESLGIPLPRAVALADDALYDYADTPFTVSSDDGVVRLSIDVMRFLIAFNARLAWIRTHEPLPARGRKPSAPPRDPIARARAHGIDLSLVHANLRRTRTQRLDALNEDMAFLNAVRARRQRHGA